MTAAYWSMRYGHLVCEMAETLDEAAQSAWADVENGYASPVGIEFVHEDGTISFCDKKWIDVQLSVIDKQHEAARAANPPTAKPWLIELAAPTELGDVYGPRYGPPIPTDIDQFASKELAEQAAEIHRRAFGDRVTVRHESVRR